MIWCGWQNEGSMYLSLRWKIRGLFLLTSPDLNLNMKSNPDGSKTAYPIHVKPHFFPKNKDKVCIFIPPIGSWTPWLFVGLLGPADNANLLDPDKIQDISGTNSLILKGMLYALSCLSIPNDPQWTPPCFKMEWDKDGMAIFGNTE